MRALRVTDSFTLQSVSAVQLSCSGVCAAQAKPSMVKSTVVDNETGKSIDSTVRTSTGTFFPRQARSAPVATPTRPVPAHLSRR